MYSLLNHRTLIFEQNVPTADNIRDLITNSATPGRYIKDGVAYTLWGGKIMASYAKDDGTNCPLDLVIPEFVDVIVEDGFQGSPIKSLTIQNPQIMLRSAAFRGCEFLTAISLPKGLEVINRQAFAECTALTAIDLPKSLKVIGWGAFTGCTSLTTIKIPDGVKEIKEWAFYGCKALTTVELPESLTLIESKAFRETGIEHISIPSGVKQLPLAVFRDCLNLKQVTLSEGLELIGVAAFANNLLLKSVVIPSTVKEIHEWAFDTGVELIKAQDVYPE